MKPIRNILILAGIIAVLCGGFYFVYRYEPAEDTEPAASSAPAVSVLKLERDSIVSVSVTNAGETYQLSKNDGQWVVNQNPSIPVNQSKVSTLLYDCASVSAKEIIEEDVQDFAPYGLAEPERSVQIATEDGVVTTVLIGSASLDNSVCYIALEGDTTVYSKSTSGCDSLAMPLSKLLDTSVYSISQENIGGITIERQGTERIELIRVQTGENDGEPLYEWRMESPLKKAANDYTLSNQVLSAIAAVSADEVIAEPANAAEYGLDSPRVVYGVRNQSGSESYTVLVGNTKGENTYIKLKDKTAVYLVSTEALSFTELSYQQLADTLVHIENIDEVSEITLNGLGKAYTMIISGSDDNAVYTINGKTIEESRFKKAYQTVIGLTLSTFTKDKVSGEAEFTIRYKKKDGTEALVECISHDDRNYVVLVNGQGNLIVRKKQVSTMIEQLEKTLAE